jgi:hypothetical protein
VSSSRYKFIVVYIWYIFLYKHLSCPYVIRRNLIHIECVMCLISLGLVYRMWRVWTYTWKEGRWRIWERWCRRMQCLFSRRQCNLVERTRWYTKWQLYCVLFQRWRAERNVTIEVHKSKVRSFVKNIVCNDRNIDIYLKANREVFWQCKFTHQNQSVKMT